MPKTKMKFKVITIDIQFTAYIAKIWFSDRAPKVGTLKISQSNGQKTKHNKPKKKKRQ